MLQIFCDSNSCRPVLLQPVKEINQAASCKLCWCCNVMTLYQYRSTAAAVLSMLSCNQPSGLCLTFHGGLSLVLL